VVWLKFTDVLEVLPASIIRVMIIQNHHGPGLGDVSGETITGSSKTFAEEISEV
jgi:hypothetical protein